ncbi:MAG: heavy-metal-associated domain-containing protein [Pseudomonadota bacterium]
METLKLEIVGMHCGGCVATLRKAFDAVAGVKSADVSLETETALVIFDPLLSNASLLTKAVTDAGYAVRPPGEVNKTAPAGGCGAAGGKTGCGCG